MDNLLSLSIRFIKNNGLVATCYSLVETQWNDVFEKRWNCRFHGDTRCPDLYI